MTNAEQLIAHYRHSPAEFPVLMEQTHKIQRDRKTVNEKININENLIHYIQDTALLISRIDGRVSLNDLPGDGVPYDHIIYLDKSARPVSWLVNMFWKDFSARNDNDLPIKRPSHSYLNIDRSPWFRKVGIDVTDDGRQLSNGELAKYSDFAKAIHNLDPRHIAEIRALYIEGGIEQENADWILSQPTILDGKRILVVDEVSRTGATLDIAKHVISLAVPDAACVDGTYFWNPGEPLIILGNEYVLTSLPVWYDPSTDTGRGIGGPSNFYYRRIFDKYERFSTEDPRGSRVDLKKLRSHAFASSVFSAPLLNKDGNALDLAIEQRTRNLCKDLLRLYDEFKNGRIFFSPPMQWRFFPSLKFIIEAQGVKMLSKDMSPEEKQQLRESPLFYLNFLEQLKKS